MPQEGGAPAMTGELPEVTIEGNPFDLMERYGSIDAKSYVGNMQLIGDEKPPQLLGQSGVRAVSEFMKLQKEELNKVKLGKGGDIESQAVIGNLKMLSTNLNKI